MSQDMGDIMICASTSFAQNLSENERKQVSFGKCHESLDIADFWLLKF